MLYQLWSKIRQFSLPEGLSQRPTGHGIGTETPVVDGEAGLVAGIHKILVELRENHTPAAAV
jgi:hypothetical protein